MADEKQNVDKSLRKMAFVLGAMGYLPFFLLALAVGPMNSFFASKISALALPSWFFAHVLTVYGAVILSFLGGIRWGVAMVGGGITNIRVQELAMSTIPSIAGWTAVLLPRSEGLYFLACCFIIQCFWDARLVSADRAPQWYYTLRLVLTLLVAATLIAAGAFA